MSASTSTSWPSPASSSAEPDGAAALAQAWAQGLRPEPALSVAAWADRHRVLSPRASAEPGRWRTARTPYLARDHGRPVAGAPGQRIVFMKGAQVGGTEAGNNWLGFLIHHAPGPGPGGPADGRAGQALLPPAGRHPDRGDARPCASG